MVYICLRPLKSEMHGVVQREINAVQGTHVTENTVDLDIANKYVTAALCVQSCQWLCLCSLDVKIYTEQT